MRSLLDVNFLIALFDEDHLFHPRAMAWFAVYKDEGWASCPMTQNSVVRINSSLQYTGFDPFTVAKSILQLQKLIDATNHQFWPDDISLLDDSLFAHDRILGPKQVTDIYLLALAAKNNGRLVTFDEHIATSSVKKARADNLVLV